MERHAGRKSCQNCRRILPDLQSRHVPPNPNPNPGVTMPGLLTPEAMSWIGRSAPPITEEVSRRDIRKYAISTGQRAQKYLNGDEAPPLFLAHFFEEFVPLDEMQPDGQHPNELTPPLPLKRIMAGGRDVQFHRPVVPGDVLTAKRTLVEMFEKEGRTGPLVFVVIEMSVTDKQGEPVMTERRTRIMR